MADKPSLFDMNGVVLGGYEIVSRLGTGGMGSVYKARDEALERFVAIKTLAPSLQEDPTCVERFLREARNIAALRHPNLMHVYAVGEEQGVHYFAMEYIEGMPLSKYLAGSGPLSIEEAFRITGQVLGALQKCHQADIVHRDLKPANIMIDSDNRVILVDFGLSKDTSSVGLTGAGAIMGTPDYMAPEQIEGDAIGPYTDIYAMAIVLYEMLSKELPFRRKSAVQTMRAHCEERPPPLTKHRADLHPRLAKIVDKAMAKKPEERYATVSEFAAALATVCPAPELTNVAALEVSSSAAATLVAAPSVVPEVVPSDNRSGATGGLQQSVAGEAKTVQGASPRLARRKPQPSKKKGATQKAGVAQKKKTRQIRLTKRRAVIAICILLLLIILGKLGKKNRVPTERYAPAGQAAPEQGVVTPRIRIRKRNGTFLEGQLLGYDGKTVRLRLAPGEEPRSIPAGEIDTLLRLPPHAPPP